MLPAGSAVTVLAHVVKPVGLCQLLVESLDQESGGLPRGVQTVCSLASADQSCVQGGVIPVQVLHINEEDIWLQPKSILGAIQEVDVLEPPNLITEMGLNDIIIQSACAEDCRIFESVNGNLELIAYHQWIWEGWTFQMRNFRG